jgi:mannose-1-phosphate guanylyltransferase/mannose-1-phosphate guanylyltransferase/mannose-6-phosphate isomerase
MSERPVIPVILSGGAGTRLWPLSRGRRPKQMLALAGTESMLRQTARRVADPALFAAPVIVASAAQADAIEAEVPEAATLILEPAPRNTAPAIALAALDAAPDDVLLVLPSDHLIADAEGFRAAVRRALPYARDGWIVTFGMTPDRPETGYGYIQRGRALADGVFEAARFVEKPDRATAEGWLAQGGYDWNGGIFLMRADAVTEGLAAHAPDMADAVRRAVAGRTTDGKRTLPEAQAFKASPAQSIDYALMEKAARVAVVPVSVGWSDIGSWAALHEVAARDADGNAVSGEALVLGSSGCLVRSDGPLVAVVGVTDLVIVATADAVLVVPRGEAQRVKEVVDRLKQEGHTQWT